MEDLGAAFGVQEPQGTLFWDPLPRNLFLWQQATTLHPRVCTRFFYLLTYSMHYVV
eukprot:UN13301